MFFILLFWLSIPSLRAFSQDCFTDTTRAKQLFTLGEKFEKAARYDSATIYYEQAAEIWKKACPQIDQQTRYYFWGNYIRAKNKHASLFHTQGKNDSITLAQVKNLLQEGLQFLGTNHEEVATTYSLLGAIYHSRSEYSIALKYFENSLKLRLAIHGPNHPKTAASYNNIGLVYKDQSQYAQALEYCQKALAIRIAFYGEKHPAVAASYNNIGVIYNELERYSQALEYYKKALDIRLATLGEKHPEVAINYSNIGNIYYAQGANSRALEYYQKALNIRLATLGEKHQAVAQSYNNIAGVYFNLNNYSLALEYYQKALNIRLAILGEKHPEVAKNYNNIAIVYRHQGSFSQALEYYQKALNIQLSILPSAHPNIAATYNNISHIYSWQKEYEQSLHYAQKALDIQLQSFGKNHPVVSNTYNNIANCYLAQNQYIKALEFYHQALISNTSEKWISTHKKYYLPPYQEILNQEYFLRTLEKNVETFIKHAVSSPQASIYPLKLDTIFHIIEYGSQILNQWRQMMNRESDQIKLGELSTQLYTTGIACAFLLDSLGIQQSSPLKHAFTFSEANKAATLLLAIQNNEALAAAGIPPALATLQQDLKREISLCNQQLETLLKPQTHEDSLKKQSLQNQKFLLNQKLDSLIHAIEKEYP
ncbi:MAG: tetratricopeptide repeat protein, partial [Bacteroidia bacterium]|nr:tetratricopeptide repeat protein [Bacteroidia bacterium]